MKGSKKGFTLVELIVVIAIIGVLAAILVPTVMGWVRAAKIRSDETSAKRLYETINLLITNDDTAYLSLHANSAMHNNAHRNTTRYDDITVNTESGSETYKLAVVARLGGKQGLTGTPSNKVQQGNDEAEDSAIALTDAIKKNITGIKDPQVLLPIKANKIGGQEVDSWCICVRLEDNPSVSSIQSLKETDEIEIWTFKRSEGWKPKFRVYPNPCKEYQDLD